MINWLSTAMASFVDKRTVFIALLATVIAFTGCSTTDNTPDVSGIKVELKTKRFDKAFAALDTLHIADGLKQLKTTYPEFTDFYLDTLLGLGVNGNYTDTNQAISGAVHSFLTHKDYRGLSDTIAKHYPDTKDVDADLTKGFQYYKYYFPNYHVPEIVYNSYWLNKMGVFTYDTTLIGICLDMFLDTTYPYYKSVSVPAYLNVQLTKDYIPVALFKTLYRNEHPFEMDNRSLLDMMIQRGKEAYYTEKILPFVPAEARLGFTEEQLKWCSENEEGVYSFFIKQNYLYETNWQKILRYVMEGPNAAGMSEKSPGEVGTWLGLQIVKAYMNENPKLSLADLLNSQIDAQRLLQESKYKPK
jgi:hypothetical protein